ncbi:glycoside hydrolase family 5 protein [Pedobacter mucosus]|uniref:glycoside hydrolase family 5 protein n=1 Tax=Pedobacter mucosus TaxID=2895286 RepID=UPI001EE44291|nr:glycoside hydrolase family 5 protein [Pedobacter mucosus]UKT64941.1 glycoside hydrolase family 5 protein [Pedobacter mucosus]
MVAILPFFGIAGERDANPKVTTFLITKGINISAWLSQANLTPKEKVDYFTEKDLQQLAALGFDHIRLPFNENQLYSVDGKRNEATFTLIHNVIKWCKEANMRVILDCHQTYDHDFSKYSSIVLFKEPEAYNRFEKLWQKLSSEFREYPNELVAYEILNEPNSKENASWNIISNKIIKAIRKSEPERIILLGSNKANRVTTFPDLQIPKNDPNIILSFHFYYPYLLTHYKADFYKAIKDINVPINYPGQIVTDSVVNTLNDEGKKVMKSYNGINNKQTMFALIKPAIDIAKKAGLRIHCGEFGSNFAYPNKDLQLRWMQDIVAIFKENDIPYTVWGYRKQFGIFNDNRQIKDQRYLDALVK